MTRDELIVGHMEMVAQIARKLALRLPPSVEIDDLVGCGYVGLVRAADRYDPEHHNGTPFSAFARPAILGAMRDSLRRAAWRHLTALELEDGRHPGGIPEIEAEIDRRRVQREVRRNVHMLEPRAQKVVAMTAFGLKLGAIGQRLGTRGSRAGQIRRGAIIVLRRRFEAAGLAQAA